MLCSRAISAPLSYFGHNRKSIPQTRKPINKLRRQVNAGYSSAVSSQDFIVASAVIGAIAASILIGLKGEAVTCDVCLGKGGATCFACQGSGTRMVTDAAEFQQKRKRDVFGREVDLASCRVCKGSGMCLCRKCGGKGFKKRI